MQIQGASYSQMAKLDVKDMLFMIPLWEHLKDQFILLRKGVQCTFDKFPQGYKHSPMTAHSVIAKLLQSHSPQM